MDWIDVALNQIDYQVNKEYNENIDVYFMDFYSLISVIDIILEATTQLSRVITGNNNMIFNKDKTVFNKNILYNDLDDNQYFKEIRSIFGAHPINLNRDNKKYFASWPQKSIKNINHVFVRLYSSIPNEDDTIFEVSISELEKYLESRYSHLNEL